MRLLGIWVCGVARMEALAGEAARHLGGWGSMYGGARRVRLLDKNSSPCLFFYIFSM